MKQLLNLKETMKFLSVSSSTLRKWDKDGVLIPIRTSGGHRRYDIRTLQEFIGNMPIKETFDDPRVVTYARCSTFGQKEHGDIERQSDRIVNYSLKKKYRIVDIIKECGSGLNEKRKGFNKILRLVTERKVDKVIIEHKDRLTRFGFDILQYFFNTYGVEIEIVDKKDYTFEEELTNDMMMLLASFSGKLYSKRARENRNKNK